MTDYIHARLKVRAGGLVAPEYRVPMMIPGVLLMPIGLFWYGWAAERQAFWLAVDVGAGVLV